MLFLAAAVIVYACKKDRGTQQSALSVAELQTWYQSSQNSFGAATKYFKDLTPNFNAAYTAIKDKYMVTELSPTVPNQLAMITGIADDAMKEKTLANTLTKFILFNAEGSKKVTGVYMVLHGNGQNLKNVHYKNYAGYTGSVLFYNINGTFENGYLINNGKIERTLKKSKQTKYLQKIRDGLAEKVYKEVAKKGERLMLYNMNDNCTLEFVDVYQTQCFQFDVEPAAIRSGEKLSKRKDSRLMSASQNYCTTVLVGSYLIESCKSAGGSTPGNDGGYPNIGGGGSGPGDLPPTEPVFVSKELDTDPLKLKFPCADKLIA